MCTFFRLILPVTLFSPIGTAAAAEYNDPSDVTRMVTSLSPILEYQRFENDDAPDDGMWKIGVEGQYSQGSILLLADLGYGYRTGTNETGITDSRIRFFHVPYRNDDDGALISALGWSIDSYLPLGSAKQGLGSGNWVFSPGLIWTHELSWLDVSPNVIYQFTFADDELENESTGTIPDHSEAARLELNLAFDVPDRYWLLVTPSYTWAVQNTQNGGSIKGFGGYNLSSDMSLGLELEWHFEIRDGLLQEVQRGQKYRVRLQWEMYF